MNCITRVLFTFLSFALLFGCNETPDLTSEEDTSSETDSPNSRGYLTDEEQLQMIIDEMDDHSTILAAYSLAHEVRRRQVLTIRMNGSNELLIRQQDRVELDDLGELIEDFYLMNRRLGPSRTQTFRSNDNYKGFDFPFYNYSTEKDYPGRLAYYTQLDIDKRAKKWILEYEKSIQKCFGVVDEPYLAIIEPNAHIRLEYGPGTRSSFVDSVKHEIAAAIYDLRNELSSKYFNATYGIFAQREYFCLDRKGSECTGDTLNYLRVMIPCLVIDTSKKPPKFIDKKFLEQPQSPPMPPLDVPLPPSEEIVTEQKRRL